MILDINFNFGTFQGIESSGHLFDFFITLFTVIGTVGLTVIAQRYYDNYKKNESLDDLYNHIKQQVFDLNIVATKYAANIKSLSNEMAKKETIDFSFQPLAEFDVELILDWKTTDFYHSVVSRRYKSNADKLILINECGMIRSALSRYKNNDYMLRKFYDDFSIKYEKYQDDWIDRMKNFENLYNYHKTTVNNRDDFMPLIMKIHDEWIAQRVHSERSNIYEMLVQPILNVCELHLPNLTAQSFKIELSKVQESYLHINLIKKSYSQYYKDVSQALTANSTRLTVAFTTIDNYKLKSRCQFKNESRH